MVEVGNFDTQYNVVVNDNFERARIKGITIYNMDNVVYGIQFKYECAVGEANGCNVVAIPKNKDMMADKYEF